MALIKCSQCGHEISDKANHCPHCGKKVEKKFFTKTRIIIGVISLVAIIAIIFNVYLLHTRNTDKVSNGVSNTSETSNSSDKDKSTKEETTTVTDIDGNVYKTVKIGKQVWMAENLRTTRYANGTSIALGSATNTTTACYYYPNYDSTNVSSYGLLYNWKAVMWNSSSSSANPSGVQGICPDGWHVPSDAEWTELTDYVSSRSEYVCGNDKEYIAKALASTEEWENHDEDCAVGNIPNSNNATGFSALPAGYYGGDYYYFGCDVYFWSATESDDNDAYGRNLDCHYADVYRYNYYDRNNGFSVRCVRD